MNINDFRKQKKGFKLSMLLETKQMIIKINDIKKKKGIMKIKAIKM